MLLVLSEESDQSTDRALEWCRYLGLPFFRLSDGRDYNAIVSVEMEGHSITLKNANGEETDFQKIKAAWFRRGYLVLDAGLPADFSTEEHGRKEVFSHLKEEKDTLRAYVFHKLKEKPSLNDPGQYNMNKLIALDYAKRCGLNIPPTLITRSKEELVAFFRKHGPIITKNIQDVLSISFGHYRVGHSTYLLEEGDVATFETGHFYSLFQKAIDKRYELRIFYLQGECFTCCIFSQNDDQTKTDFRNYNEKRPNRMTPYALPEELAGKIDRLMRLCGLESGSLDFIVDKEGQYFFLEVNPVGQYSFVSAQCNYYLDKAVVKYFLNRIHETESQAVV